MALKAEIDRSYTVTYINKTFKFVSYNWPEVLQLFDFLVRLIQSNDTSRCSLITLNDEAQLPSLIFSSHDSSFILT